MDPCIFCRGARRFLAVLGQSVGGQRARTERASAARSRRNALFGRELLLRPFLSLPQRIALSRSSSVAVGPLGPRHGLDRPYPGSELLDCPADCGPLSRDAGVLGHHLGVRAEVSGKLHDGLRLRRSRWLHFRSGGHSLAGRFLAEEEPCNAFWRRNLGGPCDSFKNGIGGRGRRNRRGGSGTRGVSPRPEHILVACGVSGSCFGHASAGFLVVRRACGLADAHG